MDSFAFIIHPIDPKRDVSRKYPLLGRMLSERWIHFFSTFFPPVYLSEITGVISQANGKEIHGWFLACPFTARRMMELPAEQAYRKIVQTGRLAEKLGAQILGLGAYTSVVGDGGVTIARRLDVPVTSGDAYTIGMAVEAVRQAAALLDIHMADATAAVVGATGAIGKVCARLLGQEVGQLYLIGRRENSLQALQREMAASGVRADVKISTNLQSLRQAELVITVTSAVHTVIEPGDLRSGSVVCDVARPRDISAQVAAARPDVLVIDGGIVEVPGDVDFRFSFGLPPRMAFACMAETMALALEGRFEDYTLGKEITLERVAEISAMAAKHGFRLGGLRSFEQAVTQEKIEAVRRFGQHPAR